MTEGAFDVTRRGYDRDQVDDRFRALTERVAAAEEARRQEAERAHLLESQLVVREATAPRVIEREADPGPSPAGGDPAWEGFGIRAEKVLRLAEQLAADLRSQSAEEAAAVLEQARADAERHRHQVEQALNARASQQDHEAARRQAQLLEREQQMAAQIAAARETAEEIRVSALREAEQLRQEARVQIATMRSHAEATLRQERDDAVGEMQKVRTVRDDVRSELARLHEMLSGELAAAAEAAEASEDGTEDTVAADVEDDAPVAAPDEAPDEAVDAAAETLPDDDSPAPDSESWVSEAEGASEDDPASPDDAAPEAAGDGRSDGKEREGFDVFATPARDGAPRPRPRPAARTVN